MENNENQLTSSGTVPRKDGRKLIARKGSKNIEFPWDPNPVFIEKGKWFFYDVDWVNTHGPYDTVEELDEALNEYEKSL